MNQLKAGAILSYLSIFITIIIAFLYTPVMIRLLGQSEYGLYALIGSIVGYLSILDLGLGNAIVRYTAQNRALGNKNEEASLNGMFITVYSLIGLITIIIGIGLYYNLDNMFNSSLTKMELEKAKIMMLLLVLNFAVSFPLGVFSSILQAYERFIVIKIVSIVRSLLIPIITLPLLFIGYGSISMVVVITLINITCLLFNVFYCFKQLNIKFKFGKINYGLLKEIGGYSFFIFLGVLVDKVYWNTDQFILGIISGTAPVAIYAIAMQFINLYMMFSTSISNMFLPKVSMMVAKNASNYDLTQIMIKFGRIQYIILAYIFSGFVLFGQTFIFFWAGNDYIDAYKIALVILLPLTVPLIQNIGISILQAKNLHGFRSAILVFIAVLNIILSVPLAKNFGGFGSAIATSISLIMGNVISMNVYYHQKIGLNMLLFWKNIVRLTIPVIVSIVIGFLIDNTIPKDILMILFLKILLFSVVFFAIMWLFGFNHYEKRTCIALFIKLYQLLERFFRQYNLNGLATVKKIKNKS